MTYAALFVVFQLPAVFGAGWIPYDTLRTVFDAGNVFFMLTLLVLWEIALFLEGVSMLEKECPELFKKDEEDVDLNNIDRACKKEYHDFFVSDYNTVKENRLENASLSESSFDYEESNVAGSIASAIENDPRSQVNNVELYKRCIELMTQKEDTGIIVNGSFFGDFSVYFFRYLSMIAARGDNILIICDSINEARTVCSFVTNAFSRISSLYTLSGQKKISFEDPIWRIHLVTDHDDLRQRAKMQDASVIITTLPFLCSKDFEAFSGSFIQLLHTVVFTSALDTVNKFTDQLTAMNQRFINTVENNAAKSKNSASNPGFRIRYKSMPIRYIAFDDSRIPGLDKALKNLLHVSFEAADIMVSNSKAIVRLYNNEPVPDEKGVSVFPNVLNTTERLGTVVNLAMTAAKAGAREIFIYENGSVPFENYRESLDANMGRIMELYGNVSIKINDYNYAGADKAVVIVFDEKCDLPKTLRRYLSLFNGSEILLMVVSRRYLYRDYYIDNIDSLCQRCQYERIPFYERTFRDITRRILLKADSGGITAREILSLCSSVPELRDETEQKSIDHILRRVLSEFGICQDDYINIYRYFEYSFLLDFDERGSFDPTDKISLRRTGQYYDIVNGLENAGLMIDFRKYLLPLSIHRISQNYIEGQNMIYEGNIYKIDRIDPFKGELTVRLASGGNNDEAVSYIQDREYIAYLSDEEVTVQSSKHIIVKNTPEEKTVSVSEIFIDVITFPMEVVTKGYYLIDPNTMAPDYKHGKYVNIFEGLNERICKQVYRKYGYIEEPFFSTDDIVSETELDAACKPARGLRLKLKGSFGERSDRIAALAGVMLNDTLKTIFPSIADCIAVCPVYKDKNAIESEGKGVLEYYPQLTIRGDVSTESDNLEFLIIEDCQDDIGLIYSLTESGDDMLNTVFRPVRNYLKRLKTSVDGSRYLYFGMEEMPACFDTDALLKLTEAITENNI